MMLTRPNCDFHRLFAFAFRKIVKGRKREGKEGRKKERKKKETLFVFFPYPLEKITEGRHIDKICHRL